LRLWLYAKAKIVKDECDGPIVWFGRELAALSQSSRKRWQLQAYSQVIPRTNATSGHRHSAQA
jgi:hypothetical protein